MIKIIIVDDHKIVRDGIKLILKNLPDIEVIGEAGSYSELEDKLAIALPDIILLDISLPDLSGVEILEILQEDYPAIKTLVLSMYVNEEFIMKSINSGASGYLPKNTSKTELIKAIRAIEQEGTYFSQNISNMVVKNLIKQKNHVEKEVSLSDRELQILKLFSEGLSNKEIADKLFISVRTVESHKNHIMVKLELKSTIDMVKYAIKNKLIDL